MFDQMAEKKRGSQVLAHLTLKGSFIWAMKDGRLLFLDGETFGMPTPAVRDPIGLDLPSGDNRRGGDFEMWFCLEAESVGLSGLSIKEEPVVAGGNSLTGVVTLSGRAPNGGTTVKLESDNPQVATAPQTVLVPPNNISAEFRIETNPVDEEQTVNLTARLEGSEDQTATLTVQLPRLSGLTLDEEFSWSATTVGGTVFLNGRAPAAGVTVDPLASDNPQVATVQGTVRVDPGQDRGRFTVMTVGPGKATIRGTLLGDTFTDELKVFPKLGRLDIPRSGAIRGTGVDGNIYLVSAVPFDVDVDLESSDDQVATLPKSVTIRANQTSAPFRVTTTNTTGGVFITARLRGSEPRSDSLQVLPKIETLGLDPSSVEDGFDSTATVRLADTARFDTEVRLKLIPSGFYNGVHVVQLVPHGSGWNTTQIDHVTVKAGENSAKFTVLASIVGNSPREYDISAFYQGVEEVDGQSRSARLTITR